VIFLLHKIIKQERNQSTNQLLIFEDNFHEISFDDIMLIQPWYKFFADSHR